VLVDVAVLVGVLVGVLVDVSVGVAVTAEPAIAPSTVVIPLFEAGGTRLKQVSTV
jgi:hypothetical protein